LCYFETMGWPERKRKNFIKLGVPKGKAYAFSRTRKGGWAIAQSPILSTTITLARLKKRGYESLLEHYLKVFPMFNEPLYIPLWAGYSGVRGAPHRLTAVRLSTRLGVCAFSIVSVSVLGFVLHFL
jgi:hypothetical protein